MDIPQPGQYVHQPVWVPFKHRMTGHVSRVLCNVRDRIISEEHSHELQEQFELPAAPGSMSMRTFNDAA